LIGGKEATGHEAEAKFPKEDAVAPNPSYVCPTWNRQQLPRERYIAMLILS